MGTQIVQGLRFIKAENDSVLAYTNEDCILKNVLGVHEGERQMEQGKG